MYDNSVGQECIQQRHTTVVWRAIQDIAWSNIIKSRILLLGDLNTNSLSWNPHFIKQQNEKPLEDLIDKQKLIINNNKNFVTYSQSKKTFIIAMGLIITRLGLLILWEIFEEYLSILKHQLVLLQWEDLRQDQDLSKLTVNTRWNIQI